MVTSPSPAHLDDFQKWPRSPIANVRTAKRLIGNNHREVQRLGGDYPQTL
jgi:hypothetical protein